MLKKRNRLSNFKKTESLKSVATPFFILKYKRQEQDNARFAFIVSKKIDKRAVVRNRVKRKLQTAVRRNIESILPYPFIIIAKANCTDETGENISRTLEEIIIKENLKK